MYKSVSDYISIKYPFFKNYNKASHCLRNLYIIKFSKTLTPIYLIGRFNFFYSLKMSLVNEISFTHNFKPENIIIIFYSLKMHLTKTL